ncbi:MAG: bifunctional (p)ppGpp synthetase/guanosine-3',5'-bis(diphosphate) 3'-pyrophosphohydrolase [Candidatus Marinimicrobia bacterium]|nr:bifunctional (p)ppGpp synthetase/guanosine-3',5'-bis(diphosphate) 3'-pyrophosphohydrolase [Candidatus Neomarinimicrobiota bacterium]
MKLEDSNPKYPKKFNDLISRIERYNPEIKKDIPFIWKTYAFAKSGHAEQFRVSGEPYFEHLYQTAIILTELSMDTTTICAGLLHDILEDTEFSKKVITNEFSKTIADIVEGVTKIGDISFNSQEDKQANNFRKMLLSVANDIRVIIVKFADRLNNMRTLDAMPKSKQKRISLETRDVYAPLAHRLGMYKMKSELEDLSFKFLEPERYNFLNKQILKNQKYLDTYIVDFKNTIYQSLIENNINSNIYGRTKALSSINKKMHRQHKSLDEIFDILAIRIIVSNVSNCYSTLGIIHQQFKPIAERFRDFIATPKSNGYQSIQTTIIGPNGKNVEIQIRTEEMNKIAETGIAAHWKYKEGSDNMNEIDKKVLWLRELVDILKQDPNSTEDFMETFKIDLFQNEIFLFTPTGDLITIQEGSTALDFAFAVHTEVGLSCIGAKVNSKIVPLNTQLSSGDKVNILTSNNIKPSYNWLKFVKTNRAKSRIRRWFRKNEFIESVNLGKDILDKKLRKAKMADRIKKIQEKYEDLGFQTKDLLFQAIGKGEITIKEIIHKTCEKKDYDDTPPKTPNLFTRQFRSSSKGVIVQGVDNIMVHFGKGCNPIPGDEIVGYITRGKGITIHRSDCHNIPTEESELDRLIEVSWDKKIDQTFYSKLNILTENKRGILTEISNVIQNMKTNIASINMKSYDSIVQGSVTIIVDNLKHTKNVIKNLKKIDGIIKIERL